MKRRRLRLWTWRPTPARRAAAPTPTSPACRASATPSARTLRTAVPTSRRPALKRWSRWKCVPWRTRLRPPPARWSAAWATGPRTLASATTSAQSSATAARTTRRSASSRMLPWRSSATPVTQAARSPRRRPLQAGASGDDPLCGQPDWPQLQRLPLPQRCWRVEQPARPPPTSGCPPCRPHPRCPPPPRARRRSAPLGVVISRRGPLGGVLASAEPTHKFFVTVHDNWRRPTSLRQPGLTRSSARGRHPAESRQRELTLLARQESVLAS